MSADDTRKHHDAVTAREGEKLSAIAQAKTEGRRRKGLNPTDRQRIVRRLQNEEPWARIFKDESVFIEPSVLEAWKDDLHREAFEPAQPVIPRRRGQ